MNAPKFGGMLKRSVTAIGVEIGTSSIKVVVLKRGTPPTLVQVLSVPTPAEVIENGEIVRPGEVAEVIKTLLDANRVTNKAVVTAVSPATTLVRSITMKRQPEKMVREEVRFAAEQYIPYPIDEVNLDFLMLRDPTDESLGEDMPVLIIIAKAESVARTLEVMTVAGLQTQVMDVLPFATIRALEADINMPASSTHTLHGQEQLGDGEAVVILDLGAGQTTISMVLGEQVIMSRAIDFTSDNVTAAFQKEFDLSFSAAEEVKYKYVADPDGEDLLDIDVNATSDRVSPVALENVIRPLVNTLITNVKRSVEHAMTENNSVVVSKMLLTGGGAKLSGLALEMSRQLGYPVSIGDPWLGINTKDAEVEAGTIEHLGPEYTVAIGLALRGVRL